MAINDVSLTAGMRSNLLSLQSTVDLLNRTQNRLSSGKKVNTAIDNPTSFFASQALTSRASVIDSLKDAMGQAVQTITAADKGIKAITAMIEQAKGIAQSALSAESSTGFDTATVTFASVADGDTINIGGTLLTASVAVSTPTIASVDIALNAANNLDGGVDTFTVAGKTYTASVGGTSEGLTFVIGATSAATAIELQGRIAANAGGAVTASIVVAGTVHIVAGSVGLTSTTVTTNAAADEAVATNNAGTPIPGTLADDEFARTGNDIVDAINLADVFTNSTNAGLVALRADGWSVTADNGVVTVAKGDGGTTDARDIVAGDIVQSDPATMVETLVSADVELANLISQYNTMRTQIDELAADSGYKGKNLLSSDTANLGRLVVQFEGTTLTVQGFDATTGAQGLNVTAANAGATDWTAGAAEIGASVDQLDAALTTLRTNTSALAGNLSIITVRQDFSTNMINTLTEGSDKLTLADANEEGANMLMLQTRQSLSTSALSMSAQAAQSVLRLFQ